MNGRGLYSQQGFEEALCPTTQQRSAATTRVGVDSSARSAGMTSASSKRKVGTASRSSVVETRSPASVAYTRRSASKGCGLTPFFGPLGLAPVLRQPAQPGSVTLAPSAGPRAAQTWPSDRSYSESTTRTTSSVTRPRRRALATPKRPEARQPVLSRRFEASSLPPAGSACRFSCPRSWREKTPAVGGLFRRWRAVISCS